MPQRCKITNCSNHVSKMCCGECYCEDHVKHHICNSNKVSIIEKIEMSENDFKEKKVISKVEFNEKNRGFPMGVQYSNMITAIVHLLEYTPYIKILIKSVLTWSYVYIYSHLSMISVIGYCSLKSLLYMKQNLKNNFMSNIDVFDYSKMHITLVLLISMIYFYFLRSWSCYVQNSVIFIIQWIIIKYYDKTLIFLKNINKLSLKPNTKILLSIVSKQIQKRECISSTMLDAISCIVLPGVISYLLDSDFKISIDFKSLVGTITLLFRTLV